MSMQRIRSFEHFSVEKKYVTACTKSGKCHNFDWILILFESFDAVGLMTELRTSNSNKQQQLVVPLTCLRIMYKLLILTLENSLINQKFFIKLPVNFNLGINHFSGN